MVIIGLTGGIGSGKSTIAKYFKSRKIPVFDSDEEADKLYINNDTDLINTIKKISNNQGIMRRGRVNKKILGEIVFGDTKKLKKLEKIIFKKLDKKRQVFIEKNKKQKKRLVVLDAPLLFENKINKICDYVILAKAPLKTRVVRILKRPGMTKIKARNIMARQMKDSRKAKLADFIVPTSFGKWYSIRAVKKILNKIALKKNKWKKEKQK